MYLVAGHMGGYYISCDDPEIIQETCEECGDYDRIILSWSEGKMMETLIEYFSELRMYEEQLKIYKENYGLTIEEIIDNLKYDFDEKRCLINSLFNCNIITEEETKTLLKQVSIAQKKQFLLLKSMYYANGYTRKKED
jgi:hypothetical protein